ncbi:MAG: protein kinase domain-containing protein [Cyanobium sp.]
MLPMFHEGDTLTLANGGPLQVIRLLGGGGQGQVFEVLFAGEAMAMKWYFPACLQRDPLLRGRLKACIAACEPNDSFLWPMLLLEPDPDCQQRLNIPAGSFGYMMKLRPPQYHPAVAHTAGRLSISLRQALRACFRLTDAFHALHSLGFCYKDISLGNLFLDPLDGRILICDNDNVDVNNSELGSVRGTTGFMAPEVMLGRCKPGVSSDLFSLAVLLFRLLTRHDPFLGRLELQIRCLDEPARRRLYAEEALFIFDADDARNRPDPDAHPAPLLTWPIYPPHLQALFEQSLGRGARQPEQRALPHQWRNALSRCLDQRSLCPHCGQEVFVDPDQGGHCWACGSVLGPVPRLRTSTTVVAAQAENELHRHHFDPLITPSLEQPLGCIRCHPQDHQHLGVQNLSQDTWTAVLRSGETRPLPPQKSCSLNTLQQLHTPQGSLDMIP